MFDVSAKVGGDAQQYAEPDQARETQPSHAAPIFTQRLDRIVGAVPRLGPGSRVLDVGSGAGALIPHLQSTGVADVLALDLSAGMLGKLRRRFADPGTLGNEPGVSPDPGLMPSLAKAPRISHAAHYQSANLPAYAGS